MKSPVEMTDEELYAEIDKGNDSGIATEDLMAIIRDRQGPRLQMPIEEFMEYIKRL